MWWLLKATNISQRAETYAVHINARDIVDTGSLFVVWGPVLSLSSIHHLAKDEAMIARYILYAWYLRPFSYRYWLSDVTKDLRLQARMNS